MIVEEFRASGQSMSAFCQQHGINKNSLSRWASRGPVSQENGRSGFALLQVRTPSPDLFAEVNGIRIFQPVSASFLKELLA